MEKTKTLVTLSNKIELKNFPQQLVQILIDELKMPNPVYEDALKNNRSVYRIKPFIHHFDILPDDTLRVPRGYRNRIIEIATSLEIPLEIRDERKSFEQSYDIDSTNIKYRGYQKKAVVELIREPEGILCAPAGSGKTVMGLSLVPLLGQPTLWLTHTDRLSKQTAERARVLLPNIGEIGRIGDSKWNIGETLTIGMVQTLMRRPMDAIKMSNEFGLVILDECLVSDTSILLLDGTTKNIADVQNGDVTTFGKVSHKFSREVDTLVELRGGWGRIKGTRTHILPFIPKSELLVDKYTGTYKKLTPASINLGALEEIESSDYLLIQEANCHTEKHIIGKDKSRLLALIACDGHIEKKLRCIQVGVKKDKDWFISEMYKSMSFVDDNDIRISNCRRGDLIIRNYSKKLIKILNEFIESGKKTDLIVPSTLEHASYEDIKNYVQVVFDTEGGLNKNQITITMSMPKFLYGIQNLLRKFGIVSRVIPVKRPGYLRLALSGYDAFLFYYKIGFSINKKQNELFEIISRSSKFVRRIEYKGKTYRCMRVLSKKITKENATVYDFTTDTHFFIANGVLSSNCHHCPATTFLNVVSYFNPYFLYGLTATPYRRDRLEKIMFQAIGPERVRITISEVEKEGGIIVPLVKYRTLSTSHNDGNVIQQILKQIVEDKKRTQIIVGDIIREALSGNFSIVISDRKAHCEEIFELLSISIDKVGIATGDYSKKYVDEQVRRFEENEITTLVTTFALLGEGFDVTKLNRAFITMPFRARAKVEQLLGRIQRPSAEKEDAIVYDYVDSKIPVLFFQFYSKSRDDCRYATYKSLGARIEPYEG